jgi:3-methyladenine DNA glycosylase AlkD
MAAPGATPEARAVRRLADPARARVLAGFFKTGPGGYGEGDRFLGVLVPQIRRLAREFRGAPLSACRELLASPWHEERLLGLLLAVDRYRRGDPAERGRVFRFYVASFPRINNWDLVDVTAEHVTGAHLWDRPRGVLLRWARSPNLWVRRIALLSTFHFIRKSDFAWTLRLAKLYLEDPQDLIHKATGWMLREVGKRDVGALRAFLGRHAPALPRTALRYAIERLPEPERRRWLAVTPLRTRGSSGP